MLSRKLSNQLFLLITVFVTMQFVVIVSIIIDNGKDAARKNTERDLVQIATILEQKVPSNIIYTLNDQQFLSLTCSEQKKALNQLLQPIVDETARQWPQYGMGIYLKEHNIAALCPYNPELLGSKATQEALKVYHTETMTLEQIGNGFTWGGARIIAANYPLIIHNKMIGHVWANIPVKNMYNNLYQDTFVAILASFLMWLFIMIIIRMTLNKSRQTVAEVIQQINDNSIKPDRLAAVPELIPVLDTVQSLKQDIRNEYEAKQRAHAELVRLDRLNTIGEMVAAMAHEIRNPMTVIMGYTQMMTEQASTDLKYGFEIIIEELHSVNQILEEFLAMSRDKKISRVCQSLNDVLQSSYPLIYAESVARGITLDFQPGQDIPSLLLDAKEIKQLVLNLARNAMEVMDHKGRLTITSSYLPDSRQVVLRISDSGAGIPRDIMDNIFAPFYTTKENGTGLGLSVCKNIVDRHNGTISIESVPGIGTTFSIYFPTEEK